uniref:heme-binding domain-containing protein n=1 Tax=Roseivirga sp. TaxID=1964215 RepID=UPI0040484899
MRKLFTTSGVLLVFALAFMSATSQRNDLAVGEIGAMQEGITFPENIQKIIDAKCMGCHKPDARNEKAKEKLQWEKVATMNAEEQAHLVAELFEILEEGKMPPPRMVERNPDMKLTDDETKQLLAWVEAEDKRLKGK